jgi:hypothetical protein
MKLSLVVGDKEGYYIPCERDEVSSGTGEKKLIARDDKVGARSG